MSRVTVSTPVSSALCLWDGVDCCNPAGGHAARILQLIVCSALLTQCKCKTLGLGNVQVDRSQLHALGETTRISSSKLWKSRRPNLGRHACVMDDITRQNNPGIWMRSRGIVSGKCLAACVQSLNRTWFACKRYVNLALSISRSPLLRRSVELDRLYTVACRQGCWFDTACQDGAWQSPVEA